MASHRFWPAQWKWTTKNAGKLAEIPDKMDHIRTKFISKFKFYLRPTDSSNNFSADRMKRKLTDTNLLQRQKSSSDTYKRWQQLKGLNNLKRNEQHHIQTILKD